MKTVAFLVVLTVVAADIEFYKTGNDNYDINALIANVTKLQAFMDCFQDKAPCTELTASYKKNIPEAVAQACKRCNPSQKHMFAQFLEGVKKVLPKEYNEFRQKYDPENKYFDALEKELSKY
ncbi:ejaculatory bulb-specific protein 3-like [Vanessa atalanta]|uniref:ejaculatory bulb-specific protein 3-like n=1 Tax=Vanessa atalanta TaxID=42275 RepID=UPI001FCD2E2B|nr:ejaculatory bulb-specific protein 3-like [Vanessa atalanta]